MLLGWLAAFYNAPEAIAAPLSAGLGVAALLPAGALWLCDRLGWLSFDRVLAVSLSPAFLLVSTAAVIATLLLGSRSAAADAEGYSGVDRALHRIALP
jgi:hypothetical protein